MKFGNQCFSDGIINFPVHRFAQITSNLTDVYYLKFNFHGGFSYAQCNSTIDKALCDGSIENFPIFPLRQIYLLLFSEITVKKIVEHCDDLQYLFTASYVPRITDERSLEGQTVIKYTKLLGSFAKNG